MPGAPKRRTPKSIFPVSLGARGPRRRMAALVELSHGLGQIRPMADTTLDARGLSCPMPVLKANRALRGLDAGDKLRVLATDRAAIGDFRAFCRETGHQLLSFSDEAGTLSFTIRRRPDPAVTGEPTAEKAETP